MAVEGGTAYRLKRIEYMGNTLAVLMQNENGPCPLLALANVLILRGSIYVHPDQSEVTFDDLTARIADYLLDANPLPENDELRANVQQNLTDGMALFPKLNRGLDVNVRFGEFDFSSSTTPGFDYSEDLLIFDLLNVRLVHGWLVDPQDVETLRAVGGLSYNQLVEKVIEVNSPRRSSRECAGASPPFSPPSAAQIPSPPPSPPEAGGTPPPDAEPRPPQGAQESPDDAGAEDDPDSTSAAVRAIDAEISALSQALAADDFSDEEPPPGAPASEQAAGDEGSLPPDLDPFPALKPLPSLPLQPVPPVLPPICAPAVPAVPVAMFAPPPAAAQSPAVPATPDPVATATPFAPVPPAMPAVPAATPPAGTAADFGLVEGMIAQEWLSRSAAQLTYYGLEQLHTHTTENQLLVFFRNNHFSTLTKQKGELYLLATDYGYLHEEEVVWERLNQVDGDSLLCDSSFRVIDFEARDAARIAAAEAAEAEAIADAADAAEAQRLAQAHSLSDGHPPPQAYMPPVAYSAEHRGINPTAAELQDPDFALALQLQREEEAAVAAEQRQRQHQDVPVARAQSQFAQSGGPQAYAHPVGGVASTNAQPQSGFNPYNLTGSQPGAGAAPPRRPPRGGQSQSNNGGCVLQ